MKIVERKEYRRYTIEGLAEKRKSKGYTQGQLAFELEISTQYLCDIEHGRRFIDYYQMKAITELLQ